MGGVADLEHARLDGGHTRHGVHAIKDGRPGPGLGQGPGPEHHARIGHGVGAVEHQGPSSATLPAIEPEVPPSPTCRVAPAAIAEFPV